MVAILYPRLQWVNADCHFASVLNQTQQYEHIAGLHNTISVIVSETILKIETT